MVVVVRLNLNVFLWRFDLPGSWKRVCLKYNKNIYNVVQTGGGGAVALVVDRRTSSSQQDN